MKTLIVISLLASMAWAQEPVCQQASIDPETQTITYVRIPCREVLTPLTSWHSLPPPKHHNWFYRHPLIAGAILGGGFALGWGLTHRDSCPSRIDGFRYDGTGPCPTHCDKDGCYVGPGTNLQRSFK